MSTDVSDLPKPRLCHLKKWPDFEGYGFHLQAMKDAPGQYIGKVDEGSPAESAKLQPGDKLIEVNGINVEGENHAQVVQRIKAVPLETKLLVIEPTAYEVYKRRGAVVRGDAEGVRYHATADSKNESQKNKEGLTMVADSADVEHVEGSRLCHLRLQPDFQGYGFNLQAEKSKPGQFIGKVEAGSPAEASGLRLGDRLLEVNGVNVTGETHAQVVQRIKAISGETKMLVVDPDSFAEHIRKMENADTSPQHHSAAPLTNGSHHQEKDAEEDAEERQYAPVAAASAAHHYADYDADRRSDSDVERQDSYDRSNSKLDDEERAALAEVDRATDHADHSDDYENSRDSRLYDNVDNENSRDSHEYSDWKLESTTTTSQQQTPPKKEESPSYAYASIGETSKKTNTSLTTSSYSSSAQPYKIEEKPYYNYNQTSSSSATSTSPVSPGPVTIDGIYFPASAREMREKMGGKKRIKDPRLSANLSMAEKHKLFERL